MSARACVLPPPGPDSAPPTLPATPRALREVPSDPIPLEWFAWRWVEGVDDCRTVRPRRAR